MFPWPVWNIILNYANCWTLRLVNSRFKNLIEKTYKFKFSDFKSLAERGTLRILKIYLNQHDYVCYNVDYEKLKLKNHEIIEHLASDGHKVSGAAIHAIKSNNLELFTYYANRFDIYTRLIINRAFKSNRFTHLFKLEGRSDQKFLEDFAFRGACSGGHYSELINSFNRNEWTALFKAFKGGNSLLYNELINIYESLYYFRDSNEQIFIAAFYAGNIEIVEKYVKKVDHSTIKYSLAKACRNGKLKILERFTSCMPTTSDIIHKLFESAGRGKNIKIIEFLLNYYEPTNTKRLFSTRPYDDEERASMITSCFYNACEFNRLNIIEYFVEIGHPCITLKIIQGAFELACKFNHIEIVKYLHPHISSISESLIRTMCLQSCYTVLDYLISSPELAREAQYNCPGCGAFSHKFKCPIGKKNQ